MQETMVEIKKRRILVVDDSPTVCEQLFLFLKQRGYACYAVREVRQALEAVEKNQYDMVFLDVVMPEMDGYTLCRKIKMMPAYKHIPVVLLTSRDSTTDRVHGLMAGCSRYLTKPLSPGELDELLANLCPLNSASRADKEFGHWQKMASSVSP